MQPLNNDILTKDEIIKIIKISAQLGVKKIRITGGEPLVRKDICEIIEGIRNIPIIEDISLTTNGQHLDKYVKSLKLAGLNRVNISLDTLKADKYRMITDGGEIEKVLNAIETAQTQELTPVKINMVPMRGINDNEIENFAMLTINTPIHVRFIELMPVKGNNFWHPNVFMQTTELIERTSKLGTLKAVKMRKAGPARYYRINNSSGVIGFISAMTHHFCNECSRIRLTSDGKLRPCLFSQTSVDLLPHIRNNDSDEIIKEIILSTVNNKPEGLKENNDSTIYESMSKIGG
ncbi:molybdenum cofactor biosynthesis protein A [Candidatus Magnetoovum chiemensis]|nr:molybdenum cofactor biosynthesis protein A [Candidatus Magnetoovum chiemensis]